MTHFQASHQLSPAPSFNQRLPIIFNNLNQMNSPRQNLSLNRNQYQFKNTSPHIISQKQKGVRINKMTVQNRSRINPSVDINLNIKVNDYGAITTHIQPTNFPIRNYSPQPKIIHQDRLGAYPNFQYNNNLVHGNRRNNIPIQKNANQNIPIDNFNIHNKQHHAAYNHNYMQNTQIFPQTLQQTKIYCVICEQFYTPNQKQDHKKKHIRQISQTKQYRSKMGTKIKQRFTNQIITRPIVQPESYNIQYKPNIFILNNKTVFKAQQYHTSENGVGTQQIQKSDQVEISPQMIKFPNHQPQQQYIPSKVQLNDSLAQEIQMLSQINKMQENYNTKRKMKTQIDDNNNYNRFTHIQRNTLVSDQFTLPDHPQFNQNYESLQIGNSLQFKNPFYLSNTPNILNDQKLFEQGSQNNYRIEIQSDHESMSRQINRHSYKQSAISNRKFIANTPYFSTKKQDSKHYSSQSHLSSKNKDDISRSQSSSKKFSYIYKPPPICQNSRKSKNSVTQKQILSQFKQKNSSIKNSNSSRKLIHTPRKHSSSSSHKDIQRSNKGSQQPEFSQLSNSQKRNKISQVRNKIVNSNNKSQKNNSNNDKLQVYKSSYSNHNDRHSKNMLYNSSASNSHSQYKKRNKTQINYEQNIRINTHKPFQQLSNGSSMYDKPIDMTKKQKKYELADNEQVQSIIKQGDSIKMKRQNRSLSQKSSKKKRLPSSKLIKGWD